MGKEIDAADIELEPVTGEGIIATVCWAGDWYYKKRIFNDEGHLIWEESYDKRD